MRRKSEGIIVRIKQNEEWLDNRNNKIDERLNGSSQSKQRQDVSRSR
jgi:hypothetical protein